MAYPEMGSNRNMNKKILITGGCGFIGSKLALELLKQGNKVVVLDNLSPQVHGDHPENSFLYKSVSGLVDFIKADIRDREALVRSLKDVCTIVHFASETGTGQSMYQIGHYVEVNVLGAAAILDLISNEKLPIKQLIIASSRAVYGEGRYSCPHHGAVFPNSRSAENMLRGDFELRCPECESVVQAGLTSEVDPLHPASIYGVTKLTQEQMFLSIGKAKNIPTIAFRYQNVYGPGQSLINPYTGILSIFSNQIQNSKCINIFEDGLESRDFVYIDDVVSATIAGINNNESITDIFNVGSGSSMSVLDVANLLQEKFERCVPVQVSGQFRLGDIRHNTANLDRIKSRLGWEPMVNFETGISKFVEWVRRYEVIDNGYQASLDEMKNAGLLK